MGMFAWPVFLFASHFGVMQVLRLTTYHRTFWRALPLLVGYSALVGWALYALELHQFFLWQFVGAAVWLFIAGRQQAKSAKTLLQHSGDDAEQVRALAASTSRTLAYYAASSIIYLIGFSITYLWLYNAQFPR
ncbi:hypothetical protein KBTX_02788 [wastewater metagenome]|uniref:Uncharacterized protein n=2 Tax=unclassified sequences TaxID=12908 RepID=A0A5B8RCB7_9ZZZZ|nr:hypothetical protein [Arhodomonas sp. KWT]QEA06450.1 hypothetical protein KBTEX_02788 [uncultured organism]